MVIFKLHIYYTELIPIHNKTIFHDHNFVYYLLSPVHTLIVIIFSNRNKISNDHPVSFYTHRKLYNTCVL